MIRVHYAALETFTLGLIDTIEKICVFSTFPFESGIAKRSVIQQKWT